MASPDPRPRSSPPAASASTKNYNNNNHNFSDKIPSPPQHQQSSQHHEKPILLNLGSPSTASASYLLQLKEFIPFLSRGFSCSEDDARTILSYCQDSQHHQQSNNSFELGNNNHRLQDLDKITTLEGQINSLTQRLERKDFDIEKLRDDVGESRSRYRALEERFRNSNHQNGQRREETRKQLILEESKVSKLTHQNKSLQMEVDRLKRLLHDSLGTPSLSAAAAVSRHHHR